MKLVRIVLRVIPLLVTFLGLYFLYQYLFVDPFSSRFLTEPLALTTVIAPLLLLFEISTFEKRLHRPTIATLAVTPLFAFLSLIFIELFLAESLGRHASSYYAYPGDLPLIVLTCLAALCTIGCYLSVQFGKATGQALKNPDSTFSKVGRAIFRLLALLALCGGVFFLYDAFFINTSLYGRIANALILCGLIAPTALLIDLSIFEKRLRRPLLAMLSFTGTFSCVALMFGEKILVDWFGIPTVKYIFYPGGPLNAITAACSTAIVLGCYLAIQFGKKTSA